VPAAQLGGWLSSKLDTVVLSGVLGIVIGITAIRMLVSISNWYFAGLSAVGIIVIVIGIFKRRRPLSKKSPST
jgi:uncharacterized membrane protein YfcA